MKIFMSFLMLLPLSSAFSQDIYSLTNSTTIYPAREEVPLAVIRNRSYRGTNKVFEAVQMDKDLDGDYESRFQIMWAHNESIVNISDDDGLSISFTSKDNIGAIIADTNHDDSFDYVLLTTDDGELVDLYEREKGEFFFEPVNEKKYLEVKNTFNDFGPFVNDVTDIMSKTNINEVQQPHPPDHEKR